MKNETIMNIIQNEYDMEMKCVGMYTDLMKRTYNPIKRVRLYFGRKMCLQHCVGINLVKRQLKKAMEIEP